MHWVPLVTEHHHGLSISPGQNERTVASGPGDLLVIGLCPVETGGLADKPKVCLLRLITYHRRPNGWELCVIAQDDTNALTTSVGAAQVSPGRKNSLQRNSWRHIKSPPRCPNVGSYMRALTWCWNLLLPRQSTRYQTRDRKMLLLAGGICSTFCPLSNNLCDINGGCV